MKQKADVIFREALTSEAAVLHQYDSQIFHDSWGEKSFLSSLESLMEKIPVAVLKQTDEIIAYAAVSWVFETANINRIAVRPEYRGMGLGTDLLKYIEEILPHDVTVFDLEVRESNKYAIEMYEKFGYTVLGKRKNFYRNPEEDALLMTKRKV